MKSLILGPCRRYTRTDHTCRQQLLSNDNSSYITGSILLDLLSKNMATRMHSSLYHPYQLYNETSRDVQGLHWCRWYNIVCAHLPKIIHSKNLVEYMYLLVQADNPWYNYNLIAAKESLKQILKPLIRIHNNLTEMAKTKSIHEKQNMAASGCGQLLLGKNVFISWFFRLRVGRGGGRKKTLWKWPVD